MSLQVYLIGSLRNPVLSELGKEIRAEGYEVFDDWFAAGPEADDYWQRYEQGRGHTYVEAIKGLAAGNVFDFDYQHLHEANIGVLLLPAGRSAHLELGVLVGLGKRTYIVLDSEPERWDVMYRYATAVLNTKEELIEELRKG